MICDDTIPAGDGEPSDPADFRGRVITAVDIAAGCGFPPQQEPAGKRCRGFTDRGRKAHVSSAAASADRGRNGRSAPRVLSDAPQHGFPADEEK